VPAWPSSRRCSSSGIAGLGERFIAAHGTRLHQVGQGPLQGLHPLLPSRLDLGIELGCFALADQVGDGRCVDQDFLGHHPAELPRFGVQALAEGLGEHPHQGAAQLDPDLGLLVAGEDIHHPIDGLGGGAGVEGPKHQVPRFRGGDRELNGFQIPHLPHQDHVGVFPERGPQCLPKAAGVLPQLALVDSRFSRCGR